MNPWKKTALVLGIVMLVIHSQSTLSASTNNGVSKQENGTAAGATAAAQKPDAHSIPITVTSNVSDQAAIQAVLIPASLAKRIFGKEISQNYAVVEIIISNRDSKASLIVQSIFLDYSHWLLSGASDSVAPLTPFDPNQTASNPSQVASVESRLVRGELLDAQQWTKRNVTMRTLVALGSTAVGFEFPFSADVNKGIGAFNGIVVPAAQALWPDGTINQINRISDVGFQTNKVIPKQSSDIVVAFFPIERFLTPGFKKEFLTDPAGWFVPKEMLADPKKEPAFEKFVKPLAEHILKNRSNIDFRSNMFEAMLEDGCNTLAKKDSDNCKLQHLLDRVSLNQIHVVLHGAMTVDQATVPATIYSVEFKKANDASIWTSTGIDQAGVIKGVYLTGGTVSVVNGDGDAVDGVTATTVQKGSTDTKLNFIMNVKNCISSKAKVFLVVQKNPQAGSVGTAKAQGEEDSGSDNSVSSTPFELPVQPATDCQAAPAAPAQVTDHSGAAAAPTKTPKE